MKLTIPQKRLLFESIDFNGLWKYFEYIKSNPHADDLKTLGKLAVEVSNGKNLYAVLSDMLPEISQRIIPQLSEQDQEEVKLFYSKLSKDPSYQQAMVMFGWGKSLDDSYKFNHEVPLVNFIKSYMEMVESGKRMFSSSFIQKMIKNNKHLLYKNPDFIQSFQNWIVHQQNKAKPTFANMIQKIIKQSMEDPGQE